MGNSNNNRILFYIYIKNKTKRDTPIAIHLQGFLLLTDSIQSMGRNWEGEFYLDRLTNTDKIQVKELNEDIANGIKNKKCC